MQLLGLQPAIPGWISGGAIIVVFDDGDGVVRCGLCSCRHAVLSGLATAATTTAVGGVRDRCSHRLLRGQLGVPNVVWCGGLHA